MLAIGCSPRGTADAGEARDATAPCGNSGEACCEGTACNTGLVCNNAVCGMICGGAGLPCCEGTACNAGLSCTSFLCEPSAQQDAGAPSMGEPDAGFPPGNDAGPASADAGPASADAGPANSDAGIIDAGPPAAGCDAGLTSCPSGCVDETTDPDNCGGCGLSCDSPSTCALGHCLTALDTRADNPQTIVVDSNTLYWVESEDNPTPNVYTGSIFKMSTAGGSVTTLISGLPIPVGLALESGYLYWGQWGEGADSATIARISTSGSNAQTLASGQANDADIVYACGIAANAGNVYWQEYNGSDEVGAVKQVDTGGFNVVTLASELPNMAYGVAADATNVYWTNWYAANRSQTGYVERMTSGGGNALTLGSAPIGSDLSFTGMAINATTVFWTAETQLFSVPIDSGPVTVIWSNPNLMDGDGAGGVAIDATSVYWTTDAAVLKANLDGTNVVTLATQGGGPIAVDATSVYFSANTAILKLTPK